jgi:hypothetical protein
MAEQLQKVWMAPPALLACLALDTTIIRNSQVSVKKEIKSEGRRANTEAWAQAGGSKPDTHPAGPDAGEAMAGRVGAPAVAPVLEEGEEEEEGTVGRVETLEDGSSSPKCASSSPPPWRISSRVSTESSSRGSSVDVSFKMASSTSFGHN